MPTVGSTTKRQRKRKRPDEGSAVVPESDGVKPEASSTKARLMIHDCSFVDWSVEGVVCIASSPCGSRVVVARADGSLEVREQGASWTAMSSVECDSSHPELVVSAMEFSTCGAFVWVARLSGVLHLYQVSNEGLKEHVSLEPGGGAIWDISVRRTAIDNSPRVAIACEDGCVRFVSPDPQFADIGVGNNATACLPTTAAYFIVDIGEKTAARSLSVCWAPASLGGEAGLVVCGDAKGGIRWLNGATGNVYGRGRVATRKGKSAKIWTVQFVQGGHQVVCGDSKGSITVWSSGTHTLLYDLRVEGLRGDIWSSAALTVPADGSELVLFGCAAGGIGAIRSQPSSSPGECAWMPIRARRTHTHDVRAVTPVGETHAMTGSMDSRLGFFSVKDFLEERPLQRVGPYPGAAGQPPVQFMGLQSLIVSRLENRLDIWKLGSRASSSPSLVLRMQLQSFSSKLRAAALSPDLSMVAVSGHDAFRLYKVEEAGGRSRPSETLMGKVQVVKLPASVEAPLLGACDIVFVNKVMYAISACGQKLCILRDGELRVLAKSSIGSNALHLSRLAASQGSSHVAVSDSKGCVFVACVTESLSSSAYVKCETADETLTVSALAFSRDGAKLAVGLSNSTIVIFALSQDKAVRSLLPARFVSVATSLSFSPDGQSILASGRNFCGIVASSPPSSVGEHLKRIASGHHKSKRLGDIHHLPFNSGLLGSTVLRSSQIAVVHRPWHLVEPSLPDAIPKKPFGG